MQQFGRLLVVDNLSLPKNKRKLPLKTKTENTPTVCVVNQQIREETYQD